MRPTQRRTLAQKGRGVYTTRADQQGLIGTLVTARAAICPLNVTFVSL